MTPRYKVGDVLYLKEPYARSYIPEMGDKYENPLQASCDPKCWETIYKFDGGVLVGDDGPVEWKNKLFMPEWAARHFIRITAVRAERLQDVSDEDCFREGVIKTSDHFYGIKLGESFYQGADDTPRETYAALIDQINGRGTWDSNPFVWVYDYELTEKP
jgi:hypothetical protein